MKIRRLPEIDLARIAPLPVSQQRKALEQIRMGFPTISYAPFRLNISDILNVQSGMFSPATHTDWAIVEQLLRKSSRSNKEFQANLGVAKALHQYGAAHGVLSRSQNFSKLAIATGDRVEYWLNMILSLDNQPVIPFIDPRRTRHLTSEGRRFVFSMMHEHIRAIDPDYANVSLGIVQFTPDDNNQRRPLFYLDRGINLIDYAELDSMIRVTYGLWLEVLGGREDETRRKSTGTKGTLL